MMNLLTHQGREPRKPIGGEGQEMRQKFYSKSVCNDNTKVFFNGLSEAVSTRVYWAFYGRFIFYGPFTGLEWTFFAGNTSQK